MARHRRSANAAGLSILTDAVDPARLILMPSVPRRYGPVVQVELSTTGTAVRDPAKPSPNSDSDERHRDPALAAQRVLHPDLFYIENASSVNDYPLPPALAKRVHWGICFIRPRLARARRTRPTKIVDGFRVDDSGRLLFGGRTLDSMAFDDDGMGAYLTTESVPFIVFEDGSGLSGKCATEPMSEAERAEFQPMHDAMLAENEAIMRPLDASTPVPSPRVRRKTR